MKIESWSDRCIDRHKHWTVEKQQHIIFVGILPSIIGEINEIFVNIFGLLMVQKIFCVLKNRLKESCSHQDSNGPPVDEIGEAHFVTFTNPL